jgi:hypothetical protein
MQEFELSFRNKHVRIWFTWNIPLIVLTLILVIVLPMEDFWIPSLVATVGAILYAIRIQLYKRKLKKSKLIDQEEM